MLNMKLLEFLRNKVFWTLDTLQGGHLKRQLENISTIMNAPSDDLAARCMTEELLKNILNYAVANIPYYSQFGGWSALANFPIVNKSIIRNNESLFRSPHLVAKTLTARETSGSTGMPFVLYQDPGKRLRATADTLFFAHQAHYELGTRLYFSRVWDKKTTRSAWQCFRQNFIQHDASALSDNALKCLLRQLENDSSTKSVIIFASTLTAMAKYLERNNLTPKSQVQSFIAISEALPSWTKQVIENRFHAPVFSRYSDEELGIMAQQKENSEEFIVNRASFHIELLDLNSDNPVNDGEEGRIVVTDFFNHAMPLIRYDTGDIAIFKPNSNHTLFAKVSGRRVDCIFDTQGNLVSPYVINTPMHEYLELQQYQFIQEGEKNYVMFLNLKDGVLFKQEDKMVTMLKSYLGEDAEIQIRYVKEIPVLKSGKRKQVVNNYKPV